MSKVPTYGYRKSDGEPKLFELEPGEGLPDGYEDSPEKCGSAPADPEPPPEPEPEQEPPRKKKRKAVEDESEPDVDGA